jgi:hypothetical protein
MTIKEFKAYLLKQTDWLVQSGPYDTSGYEQDVERVKGIKKARTWNALLDVCPNDYTEAAVNRCRKSEL